MRPVTRRMLTAKGILHCEYFPLLSFECRLFIVAYDAIYCSEYGNFINIFLFILCAITVFSL